MKLQRVWLPIVIVLLIAGSAVIVFGTHTNPRTHRSSPLVPVHYGLDIRGGIRAVLRAEKSALPKDVAYNADLVQQTLMNRVNASGVSEATVQRKGDDQFIVELPDVHDKQAILNRIGTTAQMTLYNFQTVQSQHTPQGYVEVNRSDDKTGHEVFSFHDTNHNVTFRDGAAIRADLTVLMEQGVAARPGATAYTIPDPLSKGLSDPQVYFTADQQTKAGQLADELRNWQQFLANSPIVLAGQDIKPVSRAQFGGAGLSAIVTQEFTDKGSQEMEKYTTEHTGDYMGIVLDDKVLSVPVIKDVISDNGQIDGFKSLKEAQDLADLLNAGALPVPLTIVQIENVDASLGRGAVDQSLKAGIAGLILVLIFMAFWYKIPGILADCALLIYALLTLAVYKTGLGMFEAVTFTLPGIAGFILSIGMAVDANILIFERMKEELANGKTPRAAIDAGFNRAFPAIRDSNICTMITCIVLLTLGTASVRGFALTLLIGVVVSLFSAITITRTLLFLLVERGHITDPRQLGYRPRSADQPARELNIIGRRKIFYLLSVAIIVPGLIFYFMGGLKKSIEFTGGSQIEVQYPHVVTAEQVAAAASSGGISDPLVQLAEGGTIAIVSTPMKSFLKDDATGENIVQLQLEKALGAEGKMGTAFAFKSFDKVEGIISKELTSNAIQAVIWASILIVLYLATVFAIGGFVAGLRLGMSAIAALLHDVLVLLGVFSIAGFAAGWKIDSLFVTAMLTVIGFSVHDTVVIFDRVRENLRARARGESFEHVVNRSIQQTLNRSLRTSGTDLMTLLALLFFGGHTTFQLNFALFIGILSGTYSSIFNAASILVDWENWIAKRRGTTSYAAEGVATPSSGGPSASANGGSSRPIAARPAARPSAAPRPTVTASDEDEVGISRLKGKKKKPARRF